MTRPPVAGAAIVGLAHYSPGPLVDNPTLATALQAEVQSLMGYFGITGRHYVIDPSTGALREPGLGTAEMCARACTAALRDAQVQASQVDTLICGTSTPDERLPPLTHRVQRRLGIREASPYEIHGGCAASLQCLALAAALVEAGRARCVLVALADTLSPHYLQPLLSQDPARIRTADLINACVFADGAAAVVVEVASPQRQGMALQGLRVRSRFCDRPTGFAVTAAGQTEHDHRAIREVLPEVMRAAADDLASLGTRDVDHLIVPQVNRSMVDLVHTALHDKVYYVGDRIGNCPAPAVLRAMSIGVARGDIDRQAARVGVIALETTSWTYGTALLSGQRTVTAPHASTA
jgi:3-oxoacyl-[acyl-carrier-protein] synthase-3